jgi:nucleoid DNA-binding protein
VPKQVIDVTLGDQKRNLIIKPTDREVIYTADDVEQMIDATVEAIIDGIKNGEEVGIHGFGYLSLYKKPERRLRRVDNGEWGVVPEHFALKFDSGKNLRMATAVYNAKMKDGDNPFYIDDEVLEDLDEDPSESLAVEEDMPNDDAADGGDVIG